jgi:peptide/nickel transport system permease protein
MSEIVSPRLVPDLGNGCRRRRIGLGLLAAIALFGFLGPLLTVDPLDQDLRGILLDPGSVQAWLGTDHLGRSLLSRLASATRLSLLMGLLAVISAAVPGFLLGLAAAWFGSVLDKVLTAISDAFLALPGLLLVLIVTAFAPGTFGPLYLGLSLALWVEFYRVVRNAARRRLALPDIEAARLLGFGSGYILRRHVLPDIFAPLATLLAFGFATIVLAVSALSFVGVGMRPPVAEWGSMMTELLPYYAEAPLQLMMPAVLLFLTVLGLLLIAERRSA